MRDIQELDVHIFGSLRWVLEVKVFLIKGNKARVATRQNTVNDVFDDVDRTGWCTYIPGVANLTPCGGDARAIWILLVRFDLADNHGVSNFVLSVSGDILKLDEAEGVFAFHALVLWAF